MTNSQFYTSCECGGEVERTDTWDSKLDSTLWKCNKCGTKYIMRQTIQRYKIMYDGETERG